MSNIDLSFPLEPIFTNGLAFYQALIQSTKKYEPGLVRIATYNTSINEGFTQTVTEVLTQLAHLSTSVELLVGINLHHLHISTIKSILSSHASTIPKLHIRTLKGVHVKCFLTSSCGYAGSLNLIHPTLDDLMVRLSPTQRSLTDTYFSRLWQRAEPVRIVQKLNATSKA